MWKCSGCRRGWQRSVIGRDVAPGEEGARWVLFCVDTEPRQVSRTGRIGWESQVTEVGVEECTQLEAGALSESAFADGNGWLLFGRLPRDARRFDGGELKD